MSQGPRLSPANRVLFPGPGLRVCAGRGPTTGSGGVATGEPLPFSAPVGATLVSPRGLSRGLAASQRYGSPATSTVAVTEPQSTVDPVFRTRRSGRTEPADSPGRSHTRAWSRAAPGPGPATWPALPRHQRLEGGWSWGSERALSPRRKRIGFSKAAGTCRRGAGDGFLRGRLYFFYFRRCPSRGSPCPVPRRGGVTLQSLMVIFSHFFP